MEEGLKEMICRIVDGKLGNRETEQLIHFLERNSLQMETEGTEAFFKHLAREMRQEMKGLAELITDFKKDLTSKLQPGISEVRSKFIPQATDQLEEIIESTEKAANRIMDNLETMERHTEEMKSILAGLKPVLVNGRKGSPRFKHIIESAEQRLEENLTLIGDSFEQMSFQDLTGQRIKRTIDLVNLMEERLRKTLLSFGIKITEKNRNPGISGDELSSTVEKKLSKLSGPQRAGEGMNQADIDKLLASM
jgi:chemotaxis protein CheZ